VGENDRLTRTKLLMKRKECWREKMEQNITNRMPVNAHPYDHQQRAYEFVCRLFGLNQGGDDPPSILSRGCALLMEMPWGLARA